ncbi:glycogen-binding domain-containing protein [Candidatus Eisenbacteria bacterium]|uniref:Glycogen-binding domain-containing protein n=1 Tax=Eiseniibacteriota bacterium TaxID=2212470 RepID=A0ABV6YJ43_UNCEI
MRQGRHEYMFVVDGEWMTDNNAAFYVDDGFGNQNAVLHL